MYNNQQILIIKNEEDLLERIVYTADMFGRNRRKIAEISAEFINEAIIHNGLLVMVCDTTHYIDDMGLIARKTSPYINVVVIDINTGKKWDVRDDYAIMNLHIDGRNIYYVVHESANSATGKAYVYNLDTQTESLIKEFEFRFGYTETMFAGGYFVVSSVETITFVSLEDGSINQIDAPDSSNPWTPILRPIVSLNTVHFSDYTGEQSNIFYEYNGSQLRTCSHSLSETNFE